MRPPFLLLLFSLTFTASQAQTESDIWLLREIWNQKDFYGEISSIWMKANPMFVEGKRDSKKIHAGSGYDVIIKNKKGMFCAIPGTGWVQSLTFKGDSLVVTRIDSTIYGGYNFGAFYFNNRDTIFSLGGYGLWNLNGNLRYYREESYGWEIMPLNRKLPVTIHNSGYLLDLANQQLFVIPTSMHDDGIRANKDNTHLVFEPNKVFAMDLNSKSWSDLGTLTSEGRQALSATFKVAGTPYGEMVSFGPKKKFITQVVDYRNNKILELKDFERAVKILDALLVGRNSGKLADRIVTFFHKDTLHILSSNKSHEKLALRREDLTETEFKVYQKPNFEFIRKLDPASIFLFATGTLLCLSGLILIQRSKRSNTQQFDKELPLFDQQEKQVLLAFDHSEQKSINTNEFDELLGTENRTIDALKKRRSLVIRSINEKFSLYTGSEETLISTQRTEDDRRMVRYSLNVDGFQKIKKEIA